MSAIRVLFLGDVVGEPGRKAVIQQIPILKQEEGIDFVIVNGENSAGGRGITPKISIDLLRAGAAVVTTGDHVWDQQEIVSYFPTEPRLLRPINYPEGTPGNGSVILETSKGRVAVIQVQGRSFMQPPLENPFLAAEEEIERLRADGVRVIVLEIHAETTSEKIAMGRMVDGKVSLVVGTHTHVQTGDERIFPGGTGYLTDAGMCGPDESILGRSIESVVWRFKTAMPTRFPVAKGAVRLCGVIADIDVETGNCLEIRRLSLLLSNEDVAE
ncbi:TIGR00282 family metallophosphoesterase [Luteolibacter pohnpeiensis]|uniref:TIGR00282 family metallophosphoesterase n=1 Tax=Luteolibacter pohnpeiensis TaxID=454153 RepID=A0A934VV99_9BACT|nr:TIGR00282 family metallophosphoesterase [Luteolibacter pohnpeiensis]MBK1881573.1 TIGR00282 family metallophosphoesterase [Luteolibacter pohnpeiensis]